MRKPTQQQTPAPPSLVEVEAWLTPLVVGTSAAGLRVEDRKKARELVGLLPEIARAVAGISRPTIVDAAAGRGWVGLAAKALVRRDATVVALERDARRAALLEAADAEIEVRRGDLADLDRWPAEADLVVALHACGAASDLAIDGVIATGARRALVVPCCVRGDLPAALAARRAIAKLGLPSKGEVRRRFVEAFVLGTRVLALEAGGYDVETVAFVPETVTPYNLALRGTRTREPVRTARAKEKLERLLAD